MNKPSKNSVQSEKFEKRIVMLKTNGIKPNFSKLASVYGIYRRTFRKTYYEC